MKNLGKNNSIEFNTNSIIDRLLGDEHNITDLKHAIMKDITNLLNTKITINQTLLHHLSELENSILTYGLPDFSLFTTSSEHNIGEQIKKMIEETLARHESRLKNINITITTIAKYSINFTINATFMTDPDPINIKFDSKYQPDLQQFKVKEYANE